LGNSFVILLCASSHSVSFALATLASLNKGTEGKRPMSQQAEIADEVSIDVPSLYLMEQSY